MAWACGDNAIGMAVSPPTKPMQQIMVIANGRLRIIDAFSHFIILLTLDFSPARSRCIPGNQKVFRTIDSIEGRQIVGVDRTTVMPHSTSSH
jgi:hypothetical protein